MARRFAKASAARRFAKAVCGADVCQCRDWRFGLPRLWCVSFAKAALGALVRRRWLSLALRARAWGWAARAGSKKRRVRKLCLGSAHCAPKLWLRSGLRAQVVLEQRAPRVDVPRASILSTSDFGRSGKYDES